VKTLTEREYNRLLESYKRSFAPQEVIEEAIKKLQEQYYKKNINNINHDVLIPHEECTFD
jgi:hypothetical protein